MKKITWFLAAWIGSAVCRAEETEKVRGFVSDYVTGRTLYRFSLDIPKQDCPSAPIVDFTPLLEEIRSLRQENESLREALVEDGPQK